MIFPEVLMRRFLFSLILVFATAWGVPASAQGKSLSERLFDDVEAAQWVPIGRDDAPAIYVFVDTQCNYCHEYWFDLATPYVEEGKLQVRLIPVSIINDKSRSEGAALLFAADPANAWRRHVKGDPNALVSSGDNAIAEGAVEQNTDLFKHWQMKSTPYSVYRGPSGEVRVVRGMQPGKTAKVVFDDLTG